MIGLRYVQKSSALNFYDRAWSALEARKIPYTLHWGKVNNTDCKNVRQRWGGVVDDWLAARRSFLSPDGRRMFSNDLLTACELDR